MGQIVLAQPNDVSWAKLKTEKKGVLPVYWHESRPFIIKNKQSVTGIEYELLEGFQQFLKDKYQVDLKLEWVETENFQNTLEIVENATSPCIAASAFSITPERRKRIDFSSPYMADITVMISNKNIPVIESAEEFHRVFSKLKAISIEGTTYDQDLRLLQRSLEMPFQIEYIPSEENILQTIERRPNTFGFIDLPIYMMHFSANPSIQVRRQNFYPIKKDGYALIMPKGSDLNIPINEYLNQPEFQTRFEKIVSKYLDIQLYLFVETLALQPNSQLEILKKEKEIQQEDLLKKNVQIEEKTRANYFLTALVVVAFTFLVVSIVLYGQSNRQKTKISAQQQSIEFKNQQLEQRNQHLLSIDEEKNNIIKILAHDMRTPLNQIQGLSQILLLGKESLSGEQNQIVHNIKDASIRLNKMMSNILDVDAIENNRIKIIPENISVLHLVEQVAEAFKMTAEMKNIMIGVKSHLKADTKIKVDSLYLTQVLENLISNAIKFSEKGKPVELVLTQEQNKVRISVRDQGPGLTDQDQANLFKKFQRLSTRPTNGESSIGLGLAIVKRYVDLMGGRVWCESEPGMGSAFNLEFDCTD
jgi:signal transduction histidine kinase